MSLLVHTNSKKCDAVLAQFVEFNLDKN